MYFQANLTPIHGMGLTENHCSDLEETTTPELGLPLLRSAELVTAFHLRSGTSAGGVIAPAHDWHVMGRFTLLHSSGLRPRYQFGRLPVVVSRRLVFAHANRVP